MIIDSHCHLDFPEFADDLDRVLKKAQAQGVGGFLTICTRLKDAPRIQEISHQYGQIVCSVGIHPHECEAEPAVLEAQEKKSPSLLAAVLAKAIQSERVVALGETGLDFYYEHSNRECQAINFKAHIQASRDLDLPLVVHTRNAEAETVALLKEEGKGEARGVIHCFTGSQDLARQCLDLGFYISLSGIVTFKNAKALQEIAAFLPLDRLLVETDAPYLAPVPHRGQRNEPAHVIHTLKAVADLKGMSSALLGERTTENFFSLFSRARPLLKKE
jgi:TatD DNase family protein